MSVSTKTYTPKAADVKREWRVIDATGRPLGRLASEIAQVLKGKDKPTYTPNLDTGDFVIVVNASKVRVTGNKSKDKFYYTHSMYPGGFRATSFEVMLARHPRRVIEWAVWGMLPNNNLGRVLLRKLKVYAEETHPHGAQVKELARPEKPGRPGAPKPARKVRVAPAAETVAPKRRRAPARRGRAPLEEAAPKPAPAVAEQPPVAEALAEEPQAAAPEGAAPPAVSQEPLAAPAPRTRSRRARTQESKAAEGKEAEGPSKEGAGKQEA